MKKMNGVLFLIIVALLTACDDRNIDEPTLELEYEINNHLGMLIDYDGYRRIDDAFLYLKGDEYLISNERINFLYNEDRFDVRGTNEGHNLLVTDANGVCENLDFVFFENIYGENTITFEPDDFPNQTTTFTLPFIHRVPQVVSFTVSPNTISISQNQTATVSLLLGDSDLVADQPITFETAHQTMIEADTETNFSGRATAEILAQAPGEKYVRVYLENFPEIGGEVILTITE